MFVKQIEMFTYWCSISSNTYNTSTIRCTVTHLFT